MAGYSTTPLAKRLGVREGSTLALVHAPSDFEVATPASVSVRRSARGRADVVVAFFVRAERVVREIDALGRMIFPAGSLWIAWPKRASGVGTDVSDHAVRTGALARGLVDNKVCAIDDTWTALRLVWRLEHRTTR